MAALDDIEKSRKEAARLLEEADRLARLQAAFPDLQKHVGRWNKVAYYSKSVNANVTNYDMRHNCGCCNDSPLEIWPYLETPDGNVYSDPPKFFVGERDSMFGGDVPSEGWDQKMRDAGLPERIIKAVSYHFTRSAEQARGAVDDIYGGSGG